MSLPSWTDAHCHLQDPTFGTFRDEMFRRSETFAIRRWLVNGTQPGDWRAVADLAHSHPGVVPQFGVHPWHADALPEDWEVQLKEYLLAFPDAGVGEIGLDRKLTDVPIAQQEEVCTRQLDIARDLNRSCTLHVVGAWEAFHRVLDRCHPPRMLLHSFSGSGEQVLDFARKGAWFSFGGAVIRQQNSAKLQAAVRRVPEDRILLETDAPFQHPDGRDTPQEPSGLLRIAEAVAALRGVPVDHLRRCTEENVETFLPRRI